MNTFNPNIVIGVLGGGQLGRMLLQKAADYNLSIHVLDPDESAPCRYMCKTFEHGDFGDYQAVMAFGNDCDIITIEIEHVNIEALYELEKLGKKVYPQPHILEMVQDKGLQKAFYQKNNLPTAPFYLVEKPEQIKHEFPFVQKLRKGGYDGKGVLVVNDAADMSRIFEAPSVIEDKVAIAAEIAVVTARNNSGEIKSYPVVEMQFNTEANLVELLFSPAKASASVQQKAISIAENLISKLNMVGLLAVEMFVTREGQVLINEIAPRPHNSGHHTIEANHTSQFEQLLRAILNLPLGNTATVMPAVMINLLGDKDSNGKAIYSGVQDVLSIGDVHIHLYGKKITKPYRKMGHVTVTAATIDEAILKAQKVRSQLKVIS
ncbi:MAG TPA: 5-(carboxyamino)imidazole ribonucleotide synthase [Bacteroidia bacterium]|jgi:5-(carboxyamino)imidazole ribonucleotide synthase|nr:5-(carboxyamino)imidazole ribonucleotide synthase [Bacteroidia bacterium]HMU18216.1 5-(carboxyamino)imidazole ribonucleotide synthase [Bacteroidia bacterium]